MKDDDYIEHLFVSSTHDYLLFFTNRGKVYRLKVYELPEASRTAKGRALVNLLPLREGERVQSVLSTRDFTEGKYLVFATRNGLIKKTEFGAYNTPIKADGIIAINIRDDDELIAVRRTSGHDDIIMVSRSGQAARFSESAVRSMGRDTSGVRGMNVSQKGNSVLAMDVARDDQELLVVTENGYGKRTADLRLSGQGTRDDGRQDDHADREQGTARRRAGGPRAPGARVHLPERDGPAHLGARHQPLRPRLPGRPRDEPPRRRPGQRGRAGGRVRGSDRGSGRRRRPARAGRRGRRRRSSAGGDEARAAETEPRPTPKPTTIAPVRPAV